MFFKDWCVHFNGTVLVFIHWLGPFHAIASSSKDCNRVCNLKIVSDCMRICWTCWSSAPKTDTKWMSRTFQLSVNCSFQSLYTAHSLCKVYCLPACLATACHGGFVAICRCAVATKSISLYHVAKGLAPSSVLSPMWSCWGRGWRSHCDSWWQVSEMTNRDVHPRSSKYISRSIVDNQSWSVHRRSYFIDFPNKYTPTLPNRALENLNPGKNGIWDTLW